MQRRGGSGGVGSEEGGKKDVGGNGDEGAGTSGGSEDRADKEE